MKRLGLAAAGHRVHEESYSRSAWPLRHAGLGPVRAVIVITRANCCGRVVDWSRGGEGEVATI